MEGFQAYIRPGGGVPQDTPGGKPVDPRDQTSRIQKKEVSKSRRAV